MECHYCHKQLSNKSSLKNHQKNAKYCLKIQGKINKDKPINLKCSNCNKEFKQKGNLDRHYNSCKNVRNKLEDKDQLKECKLEYQDKKIEEDKKVCNYCYKEFSSRQTLSIHKLKRCIFLQLEDRDREYRNKLENRDKEHKKRIEEHIKKLEDKDMEYKKQIEIREQECKKQLEFQRLEYKNQIEDKDLDYKKQIEIREQECKKQLEFQRLEYREQIEEYKNQISTLQDKLENIALKNSSKTTINNNQRTIMINNYIDKMKPLTEEVLLSYVDNLTEEHVLDGRKGIAKYVCEYPMKGNILCTDISRKKIKYKDAEGNIQTDVNMSKLKKGIFKSIKPRFITIKDNIDNSDRFKIDRNLPIGDQRILEKIHWYQKCNIVNTLVDLSNECKGNSDTELSQIVTKKVLELSNI